MKSLERHFKVTAQEEYRKNPKLSSSDVRDLLEWSNANIEIEGKFIDLQIIMFLHACGFDLESARRAMGQCYTLRAKKCDCYFSGRDPSHVYIKKQLDVVNVAINSDQDSGYGYLWTHLKVLDPPQYYPTVATKILFMAIELDYLENGTRPGYRLILDSNNFGLGHALRHSLNNARHLMTYVQEGTPFIIEKIYVLNVNVGTEKLYQTMKPFMNSSLINKIVIKKMSKTKEFLKTMPQNIVPKEYGGLAPSINETNEKLIKKLSDYQDYFLDEEIFRNGTVKVEKDKSTDAKNNKESIPSFRNLSID